jgi:S1-C subfamily serine protease
LFSLVALLIVSSSLGCAERDPTIGNPQIACVRIEARSAEHSATPLCRGFIASADGYIITSARGLDTAQDITVTRQNGDKLFADFVQADKEFDLAILKIHAANLPFLKLETEDAEPGMHLRILATTGTTHATFDHWESLGAAIGVSAPLSPIDVGSPILADDGRVVAVAAGPMKDRPGESLATPIFRVLKMMPALGNSSWLPGQ